MVITWILVDTLQLKYAFLFSITAGFLRTVPFLATAIVGLCASIYAYLSGSIAEPLWILALLAVYVKLDFDISALFSQELGD
jgi:predicted PurR-regulated permease PerM